MDEVETLLDELRDAYDDGSGAQLLGNAAAMVEKQNDLLRSMGEFIAQYREEFEENLSYEQQEQYREYFGLEHSTLGESGAFGAE